VKDRFESEKEKIEFEAYPIRARRASPDEKDSDTVPQYFLSELERLAHYYQSGHLASHPYHFKNINSK
jgi:hypothetical protein